jgi:hypothetical protein
LLLSGLPVSISLIMFIVSSVGMLLYMFSMSNEHIRISLLSSMFFKSVIKWIGLRTLYVYGRYKYLRSVFVKSLANSYASAFF